MRKAKSAKIFDYLHMRKQQKQTHTHKTRNACMHAIPLTFSDQKTAHIVLN